MVVPEPLLLWMTEDTPLEFIAESALETACLSWVLPSSTPTPVNRFAQAHKSDHVNVRWRYWRRVGPHDGVGGHILFPAGLKRGEGALRSSVVVMVELSNSLVTGPVLLEDTCVAILWKRSSLAPWSWRI